MRPQAPPVDFRSPNLQVAHARSGPGKTQHLVCFFAWHTITHRAILFPPRSKFLSTIADLARDSDIVVFNVPLTKETQHMVNTETIPRMKRGALIVNTGRGGLIDAQALVEGIKSGQIGGAALDVYQDEAPIFYSDRSADVLQDDAFCRLMTFPNVIVTSHMAYLTDHALSDIAQTALQAFSDFEKGRPLATRVVASGPT